MEDWQERVGDERHARVIEAAKLEAFFDTPAFHALPHRDQFLMQRQHAIMGELIVVLGQRIQRFK